MERIGYEVRTHLENGRQVDERVGKVACAEKDVARPSNHPHVRHMDTEVVIIIIIHHLLVGMYNSQESMPLRVFLESVVIIFLGLKKKDWKR